MIIDPTDEGHAIDDKGRLLSALRFLPAGSPMPPTMAEMQEAPILGYCAPEDITFHSEADDE